ncbi:protein FAM174C [Corythoichthys intestinalis]|uniref:protein FAM174C n=1 Tax=Corythoichthys intestinalis TaxID=161448 RepID=UPI0025A66D9C|nr:protein FAM174C [Corythoichthys intestinalis]XP_061790283.1 membrane protein FAM174A-like [Nerophis lumbriciformis]
MAASAFVGLVVVSLAALCRTFAADNENGEARSPNNSSSGGVGTAGSGNGKEGLTGFGVDPSMMQRAAYVLIAITAMGFLYFIVRAGCVKKTAPRKKYGLLSRSEDTVELTAAASDDEDDNTLYEARPLRR